jgi:hypothetical protein
VCFAFALSATTSACKSDSTPKRDPSATPGTEAVEDPNLRKKITANDCTKWAENGVTVVIAGFSEAVKDCPDDQKKAFVAQLESSRAEMRTSAVGRCAKHVGEEYVAKDGNCLFKAKTIPELTACNFAPINDPQDTDLPTAYATVRKTCGRVTGH